MIKISNAAGTVKHIEQAMHLAKAPVDEIVIGSYTLEPREGNPGMVYSSQEGVVLNSLGMPNPGIVYLHEHFDDFKALDKPVVVSIAGFNVQEYLALAVAASWASAIEINFGCPNVWNDGRQHRIGSFDLTYMQRVIDGVAGVINSNVDLRVKLSPYSDPFLLNNVAATMDVYKVGAIVASNTFPNGWLPGALDLSYGGVSGAAMKAIVLGQVRQFKSACGVPVIASGGVRNGADLMDCEAAGASGAQVGSRYLDRGEDPDVFVDILGHAAELDRAS